MLRALGILEDEVVVVLRYAALGFWKTLVRMARSRQRNMPLSYGWGSPSDSGIALHRSSQ